VIYWKQKCRQLETQLQEVQSSHLISSNDVEVQCSMNENEQKANPDELIDKEILNKLNSENEQLKNQINLLKEEINNLNFQLSSISIQRSTTTDVSKKQYSVLFNVPYLIDINDWKIANFMSIVVFVFTI
jgi:hypothetical protein